MSGISKFPYGITSILGLKDMGLTVREFAQTLAPTIDLTQLFMLNQRETIGNFSQPTPVLGANQFNPRLFVPAGELWYVWDYNITATTGAGEAIELACGINYEPGIGLTAIRGDYNNVLASQAGRIGCLQPFWAPPGTEFGFAVKSLTLAPDVFGGITITRLRV